MRERGEGVLQLGAWCTGVFILVFREKGRDLNAGLGRYSMGGCDLHYLLDCFVARVCCSYWK